MKKFEKVTMANFRSKDYLLANPDARLAMENQQFDQAYQHFLSVKEQHTRYQYLTKSVEECPPILLQGNNPENLLSLIDEPLEDLSKYLGGDYSNVYAPLNFINMEKLGVSSQFLEDCAIYHKNYFNIESGKFHYQKVMDIPLTQFVKPTILDLGSGSGKSVFACCELFDGCSILATDISHELLKILVKYKKEYYPSSRIEAVAMDALHTRLRPSSFDIFTGFAILHHLVDIDLVFQTAYSALRENGCVFFFEPMLSGYIVVISLLKLLLKRNEHSSYLFRKNKLSRKIVNFFMAVIWDWTERINSYNKMEHVRITDLDDKWIFTRQFIETAAKEAGFRYVEIVSINEPPRYKHELTWMLRTIEVDFADLPKWAKEIVDSFDEGDILCGKNDIILSAGVICRK